MDLIKAAASTRLTLLHTAFLLVLGMAPALSQSGPAVDEEITFFCGIANGEPATIARTSEEEFPVIFWQTLYFRDSGWDPQKRCEEVSRRLQAFNEIGILNDLVPATLNGQPVVCLARSSNGLCSGLLFTLEEEDDPEAIADEFRIYILPPISQDEFPGGRQGGGTH